MSKRQIRTFENAKLRILSKPELEQRRNTETPLAENEITAADAREIELLSDRFENVNPAKWARVVKGGQSLQLGQYVGAISTSVLNIIISPKVDEIGKSGRRKQEGCVDLSVLIRSAKSQELPKEEFADPGVIDLEVFFLHVDLFITELSREIRFGLRCGYVPVSDDLKSLRGTLDTDKIALKSVISPELIPCKFEEFEQNTLHNQILRRAVVIIRSMLVSCEGDQRVPALIRSCDELLELLVGVSDIPLTWADISFVELGQLESRYRGIFHYAKLLIKCAAPIEQGAPILPGTRNFQSGFSQVWDAAVLYERHIANYLDAKLKDGQKRKRKVRYRVRTQKECSRNLVNSSDGELGYYEIRPDIIIWDEEEDRAHLIIDTKWKKHDGTMSDARQADAYQVHAYSTTYSKSYKTKLGRAKKYYPPVCLLYPIIGADADPIGGEFAGTGSAFLLASAPMDEEHFEFDPAVVFGRYWPV